jgi:hypothetical protein
MTGAVVRSLQFSVLSYASSTVSGAADTNENILGTITVPGGILGPRGILRITSFWTITSSANNKTIRVRFSGIGGTQYRALVYTTSASVVEPTYIFNKTLTTQAGSAQALNIGLGAANNGLITSSVDTSVATTVVLTAQKASAGETMTLEHWVAEYMRG